MFLFSVDFSCKLNEMDNLTVTNNQAIQNHTFKEFYVLSK